MIPRDPLCPSEIIKDLGTRRLGKAVHYFEEIESTNSTAFQLAEQGAAEGEIVVAEGQTQGRGRLGRSWASPPYLNLYISVILRPALHPTQIPQVTLMAAVALARSVETFTSYRPEIKWPNDVLVRGRKLAGILAESSSGLDGGVRFVILGIGVNLNFSKALMAEQIRKTATSLMILNGKPVDRLHFSRRLIQDLDQCYGDLETHGFEWLGKQWESYFSLRGRVIKVTMYDHCLVGKALGIDGDGALLVETERGAIEKVLAGDVEPVNV